MTIVTGSRRSLPKTLVSAVKKLYTADTHSNIIVVVPDQLTLETEMLLLNALHLSGSFRINVVSAKRLCERIFEETGSKTAIPVTELGRTMIIGYLLRKNADKLKWYKKAASQPGFESSIVEEITRLRQAGVKPEELIDELNAQSRQDTAAKLNDLTLLYSAYNDMISGHMQDGEDEIAEAVQRMNGCRLLQGAGVLFYGFDITTPAVNMLICGISKICDTKVLLPLSANGKGGDKRIFEPLLQSAERLHTLLSENRIEVRYELADDDEKGQGAGAHLAKQLFCMPAKEYTDEIGNVTVTALKDQFEENRFAAGIIRKLVREKGWRYRDIRVVCMDSNGDEDAIASAFKEFDVPYFSQSTHSESHHPLCVLICETLKLISGKNCSISALLTSGYTVLDEDEAEALLEYCRKVELKPYMLFSKLRRGDEDMLAAGEKLREKFIAPVANLRERLEEGETLKAQLSAIYDYLIEIDCPAKSEKYRSRLTESGFKEAAAVDIQIWNRLIGVLDEMLELLGPEKLPASDICDLVQRALNVISVKLLPLSPDCVQITKPERSGMLPVKAVIVTGVTHSGSSSVSSIFDVKEIAELSEQLKKHIAPDVSEKAKNDRMYIKDALSLAEEEIYVSWHISDEVGNAVSHGALIDEIKCILPKIKVISGENAENMLDELKLTARTAALNSLSQLIGVKTPKASEAAVLRQLSREGRLNAVKDSAEYVLHSEPITPSQAHKLYRSHTSVTQLEDYAGCPFASFIDQGIRPERSEKYELDRGKRGEYMHECVKQFVLNMRDGSVSEDEAASKMDAISLDVLNASFRDYLGEDAIAEADASQLRRVVSRAARMLAKQLKKGVFKPVAMELDFGNDGKQLVKLSEGTPIELHGRIDRVDAGIHNGEKYAFVVDYKSSKREIKPTEIYMGMQIQLLMYLMIALKKFGASSAGVYYFALSDKPIDCSDTDIEKVNTAYEKEYRMNGLAPDDIDLLKEISDEPDRVINVTVKKSNELSKSSNVVSREDFDKLNAFVLKKIKELADGFFSGDTEITPVAGNGIDACRYCMNRSVCLYDENIDGIRKRKPPKLKLTELLETI